MCTPVFLFSVSFVIFIITTITYFSFLFAVFFFFFFFLLLWILVVIVVILLFCCLFLLFVFCCCCCCPSCFWKQSQTKITFSVFRNDQNSNNKSCFINLSRVCCVVLVLSVSLPCCCSCSGFVRKLRWTQIKPNKQDLEALVQRSGDRNNYSKRWRFIGQRLNEISHSLQNNNLRCVLALFRLTSLILTVTQGHCSVRHRFWFG